MNELFAVVNPKSGIGKEDAFASDILKQMEKTPIFVVSEKVIDTPSPTTSPAIFK
jgi:hypothetical protein